MGDVIHRRCGNRRYGLVRLASSGARITGIHFSFVEGLMALAVIAEKIAKPFGIVDLAIVVIAERNDRGIFIEHPDKDRSVPMPPTVVIDQLFTVRDKQYAPSKAVIPSPGLFERISSIGAVQHAFREQLSVAQRLVPFIDIPDGAVNILVAVDQVKELHPK